VPWAQVVARARGQTVTMQMWQGDPAINAYMNAYVAPKLKHDFDITLALVPGQGDAIVNRLMTEKEAGRAHSAVDLVWINGQTFYQLRQIHALWGPFTQALPNNRLIDWSDPFIAYDFQQPVEGLECPRGKVQLLLITNRKRVPVPPRNPAQLARWIHAHPGRFTFDTGFTGMSFLKSLMYAFADSPKALDGPYNAATYVRLRHRVFDWIRSVRSDLWRHGRTFPTSTAQMYQLFANGEIDFAMSYNDGEVDNKIDSGLFPASAYAFVLHSGTLRNSHYIGITAGSAHKAASMVVANFLISPAAQLEKLKPSVWGDGTVLDIARLPAAWQSRFRAAEQRRHSPTKASIRSYALREPAPEVMIRLSHDFRRRIVDD
jgi:putative spermidine/putrescine transport system substrate-binding protein